ncbi:MAG: oxygen-independent coproporphyrinogen III oxidase-like protein [Gammaproteobacteria bacterium]|nr:oxygen-independent coproporphyrinogen III oxidase-like protein [Gammaproteobacteria bacterium]
MLDFKLLPPLSLYVHIPWCVRKCPYCDFNSHAIQQEVPASQYISALMQDLEHDLHRIWGRRIQSVFIGGGTPSLFSSESIDQLLSALRARLMISANAEITLEANPGTVDYTRFFGFREAGINRLSIGVQSFNNEQLQQLGRVHCRGDAIKAIEMAHQAGFDNINIDLMFGLVSQTQEQALNDINLAVALSPRHISYYQLTIEPNTYFHRYPPILPQDDLIGQIQLHSQQLLAEHGFQQYEVSAYAKTKHECVHNRNYWEFGDYLGIGAGAHSKITDMQQQKVFRFAKQKHPVAYMEKAVEGDVVITEQALSPQEMGIEFMMNALRLTQGFQTSLFTERAGVPMIHIEKSLKLAEQKQLIDWSLSAIRPTDRGKQYLNDLLELFLPEK